MTHDQASDGDQLTCAVVGGGIAGLAAAYRLREQLPDAQIVIIEASDRVGGKLRLDTVAGTTLDVGAEAMLNRRPEATGLARAVGFDLLHPEPGSAMIWSRGEISPLPPSLMGVPTDLDKLAPVISSEGIARARQDLHLPATEVDGDISIGDLVEQRFGAEVVDRLVEPLLGGVYAGHAREISARAAVPAVLGLLEKDSSLAKAAGATMPKTPATTPVFAGIPGGMGRLPAAVADAAGAQVSTNTTVRSLARTSSGWRLVVGPTTAEEVLDVDLVVLATPAAATSKLIGDVAPRAAKELSDVEYASMAIVTLAFTPDQLPDQSSSGFLVPPVDGRDIKAATFSFAKWNWVKEASNGTLLMRASMGRHRDAEALQADDSELVARAVADLAVAVGAGTPLDSHVQRWGGGLPQYAVGHLDKVAAIKADVATQPGLAVCGAAYDGVGIPAVIASAQRAVDQVLAQQQAQN